MDHRETSVTLLSALTDFVNIFCVEGRYSSELRPVATI